MPYLHFSKFLIMKHNFTHCTTLHKYYELLFLKQSCTNLRRTRFKESVSEDLLCQSKPGMSNPRPSLGCCCSKSILHTNPYFDNREFDVFDAGGPQCHFITTVTIAVKIQTLSVRYLKLNLVC